MIDADPKADPVNSTVISALATQLDLGSTPPCSANSLGRRPLAKMLLWGVPTVECLSTAFLCTVKGYFVHEGDQAIYAGIRKLHNTVCSFGDKSRLGAGPSARRLLRVLLLSRVVCR